MSDDKTLSDTYRAVSTEQTPELLDRRIRAMARKRPVNRWRHIGLAATVVLCFAFLVDLGQFNAPDDMLQTEKVLQEVLPERDESEESSASAPKSMQSEPVQESYDAVTAPVKETETLIHDRADEAAPAASSAVATRARKLEEARSTSDRSRVEVQHLGAASADADAVRHCTPAQTADPGSWYACILALRKDGQDEAANSEQSLLQTKFPDFEIR